MFGKQAGQAVERGGAAAALGDKAGDEAGGRHVEGRVRGRAGVRHNAHAVQRARGIRSGDGGNFLLRAFLDRDFVHAVAQVPVDRRRHGLARGERLTRLLRQGQYSPYRIAKTIMVVFAGNQGFTDELPIGDIDRYESEMLQFMDVRYSSLLDEVEDRKKLDDDLMGRMKSALTEFGKQFSATAKG